MTELMKAHDQWMTRPDDERFLTLDALAESVGNRRDHSTEHNVATKDLRVNFVDDEVTLTNGFGEAKMSNWIFGRLAVMAGAPAKYLRTLPNELAAVNIQWGLDHNNRDAEGKDRGKQVLLHESEVWPFGENKTAMAVTSQKYGRIWDIDVVNALRENLNPEVWKIPPAPAGVDPLRATTLYASDRDTFIFLVDEERPIEVPGTNGGETLFRGFFVSNSEVGKAALHIDTFLYREVCANRIVWGAQGVSSIHIRHNAGGPERFVREAEPALTEYLNSGTISTVAAIKQARETEVGATEDDVSKWLVARGFTQGLAAEASKRAAEEPGNERSVWNLVQGLTAHARDIPHTDDRVALETKAGRLMETVSS